MLEINACGFLDLFLNEYIFFVFIRNESVLKSEVTTLLN